MMKLIKNIILIVLAIFGKIENYFKTIIRKDNNTINFQLCNMEVFFGYYDISPLNYDNTKLLANVCQKKYNQTPGNDDYLEIGFFDLTKPENHFVSIDKTNTWCWQQGCRLQWIPQNDNQIIYNKLIDGKYGIIIFDIAKNKVIKEIHSPVYALNPMW